jgi:hypothetical protein
MPSAWLQACHELTVSRAPTRFGPVSYRLAMDPSGHRLHAEIEPPVRDRPAMVVLRLRHPAGAALRSVAVEGGRLRGFDASGLIRLRTGEQRVSLTADFAMGESSAREE